MSDEKPSLESIRKIYEDKMVDFQEKINALEKQGEGYGTWRLLSFSSFLAFLFVYFSVHHHLVWLGLAVAGLVGFFVLVAIHQRLLTQLAYFQDLYQINRESIHRLDRKWKELPKRLKGTTDIDCPYADDLDLFGRASLFQLINTASTEMGRNRLSQWLTSRADKEEITARQEAVAELAPQLDFRQKVYLHARRLEGHDPQPFLQWAENPPYLVDRPLLRWLAPIITVAMSISLFGAVLGQPWGNLWWLLLVFNIVVTGYYAKDIDEIFSMLTDRGHIFVEYSTLIEALMAHEFKSPRLAELQKRLGAEAGDAPGELKKLQFYLGLLEQRHSALFYVPFQFLFLLDLHLLKGSERWQIQTGDKVRGWLETIGEMEALAAFSSLAHDEPIWSFPEIVVDEGPVLVTESMGHPLIPRSDRVDNDFELGEDREVFLITGSNMSGKTTFLRTIGINLILAQAGAPVAAASFKTAPFEIRTTIRIRDSLEQGISYFMAEVYRIKDVVERARELADRDDLHLLFLLDEIFHGTNSEERREAAIGIVNFLHQKKAVGLVTTHDLTIAQSKDLEHGLQYHFTETIDAQAEHHMTFDYQLREGLATSSNALELIEMVGIELAKRDE